ncbi:MAG: SMC-Scp complex subunit ScpB [Pseudomonadota bacterium]
MRDPANFDQELADHPPEMRWRIWMGRVEAAIFASAVPLTQADLAPIVGQGVPVEQLVDDIRAELQHRPYTIVDVAGGWAFRTKPRFAAAIRAAADLPAQGVDLDPFEGAVLAAIAYHQPVTRDGLKEIFGKEVSRDLITRLRRMDLVTTGPRSPRRGAPHTYVTTPMFLTTFDLHSLRDLPDIDAPH